MNFIDFARTHGVEINALRSGDRIWRCPTTTHPKSRNGAYFFDGQRGWVQAWDSGEPVQWWSDAAAKPWTDADKADWARRRDAETRQRIQRQREAAKRAQELLGTCEHAPHNYLAAKGFPDVPVMVTPDYAMVIPMRDVESNELLGAQVIAMENNAWTKKMLLGMRAKGAVLRLGPKRVSESVLCEGFATGLSIGNQKALHSSRHLRDVLGKQPGARRRLDCWQALRVCRQRRQRHGRRSCKGDRASLGNE